MEQRSRIIYNWRIFLTAQEKSLFDFRAANKSQFAQYYEWPICTKISKCISVVWHAINRQSNCNKNGWNLTKIFIAQVLLATLHRLSWNEGITPVAPPQELNVRTECSPCFQFISIYTCTSKLDVRLDESQKKTCFCAKVLARQCPYWREHIARQLYTPYNLCLCVFFFSFIYKNKYVYKTKDVKLWIGTGRILAKDMYYVLLFIIFIFFFCYLPPCHRYNIFECILPVYTIMFHYIY